MRLSPSHASSASLLLALTLIAAQGALAFKTTGPEWIIERGPITFRLHEEGSSDVADGSDLEALRRAFAAWSCIEGSGLRFVEGPLLTERSEERVQNEIRVYFDNVGQFGIPPENQSQTFTEAFFPDEFSVRDAANIVFNDANFNWSSTGFAQDAIDIETFMHIEIAVALGLDRPCDANEQNCLGADQTVLVALIPGTGFTAPGPDDAEGIRSLYGVDDGSSCEGPFRVGEVCTCNEDCVADHVCAPSTAGELLCQPTCTSDAVDCAIGYGCLLALDEDGEGASGYCAKADAEGLVPIGATCDRDGDCSAGLCTPVNALARNVCRVSCEDDEECGADYVCEGAACIFAGAVTGELCEGGCACNSQRSGGEAGFVVALMLGLVLVRRRRS